MESAPIWVRPSWLKRRNNHHHQTGHPHGAAYLRGPPSRCAAGSASFGGSVWYNAEGLQLHELLRHPLLSNLS